MGDSRRAQLLSTEQKIRTVEDQLADATRIAADTEGTGAEVLNTLYAQRLQIERTTQHVHDIDGHISGARRAMNTMRRRAMLKRVALIVMVLILVDNVRDSLL